MQELPENELDALANVPPTLKVLQCGAGLSGDEWALMPKEVQLGFLKIKELDSVALDQLIYAWHIYCHTIQEAVIEHLPTKVPHLRTLSAAHVPKGLVMRLSCMPDLAKLSIKHGEENVIDLSKGFPALKCLKFSGKCKNLSAPGLYAALISLQIR